MIFIMGRQRCGPDFNVRCYATLELDKNTANIIFHHYEKRSGVFAALRLQECESMCAHVFGVVGTGWGFYNHCTIQSSAIRQGWKVCQAANVSSACFVVNKV